VYRVAKNGAPQSNFYTNREMLAVMKLWKGLFYVCQWKKHYGDDFITRHKWFRGRLFCEVILVCHRAGCSFIYVLKLYRWLGNLNAFKKCFLYAASYIFWHVGGVKTTYYALYGNVNDAFKFISAV